MKRTKSSTIILFNCVKLGILLHIFLNNSFPIFLFCSCIGFLGFHLLLKLKGLSALTGNEPMYFIDKNRNCIVPGCLLFSEMDIAEVRNTVGQLALKKGKQNFRRTVKCFLGEYYWHKELSPEQLDLKQHIYDSTSGRTFEDMKQLGDYTASKLNLPMDLNKPLWDMEVFHGVFGNNCAVVVRLHHCIGDGISVLISLLENADDYKGIIQKMPKPASFLFKIAFILGFPLLFLSFLWKNATFALSKADDNILKREKNTYISHASISERFPLEKLKMVGKKLKVTINEFLTGVIMLGMREYFEENKDGKVIENSIQMIFPASIREELAPNSEIEVNNRVSGITLQCSLPPIQNVLEDGIKLMIQLKHKTKPLKNTIMPIVAFSILEITMRLFPSFLVTPAFSLADKCSFIFTNIAASKQQLHFNSTVLKEIFLFVPNFGNISVGVGVISYGEGIRITANSDLNSMKNPHQFIQIIEKFMKQYLEAYASD